MAAVARHILEHVLRDKTMRRHLPAEFGRAPILISAAGGLGALLKPIAKFDPTLLRLAKSVVRPGNIVWDLGANIGLFSVASAVVAGTKGKVFGFEPDAVLVQQLRRTAALQSRASAPITVVPVAIASGTGLRSFSIAKRARASNALSDYGHSQMGGVAKVQTVVTFGLDDLARWLPAPDIVKIDVEGAEIEVLLGGSAVLHTARPAVICEVVGENAADITRHLMDAGYSLYDGSKPLVEGSLIASAAWSTVALPEERQSQYLSRDNS